MDQRHITPPLKRVVVPVMHIHSEGEVTYWGTKPGNIGEGEKEAIGCKRPKEEETRKAVEELQRHDTNARRFLAEVRGAFKKGQDPGFFGTCRHRQKFDEKRIY